MNPQQNWTRVKDALQDSVLFTFSATCYYFGESLIDKLGADAPPIGLIHTACARISLTPDLLLVVLATSLSLHSLVAFCCL